MKSVGKEARLVKEHVEVRSRVCKKRMKKGREGAARERNRVMKEEGRVRDGGITEDEVGVRKEGGRDAGKMKGDGGIIEGRWEFREREEEWREGGQQ